MAPKPRWYFILMHVALITSGIITIVLGSMAIAIVIRQFTITDWELANLATGNRIKSIIVILPYLWLLFIGLTIYLADTLFKHTKKGHRFKVSHVVLASILISVFCGNVFYLTHADEPVEAMIRNNIKPYQVWQEIRQKPLVAPDKGVIAGRLIKKEEGEKEEWKVVDFRGKEWLVDISEFKERQDFEPRIGMPIGIKGSRINGEHFKVERMRPWRTDQRFYRDRDDNNNTYNNPDNDTNKYSDRDDDRTWNGTRDYH